LYDLSDGQNKWYMPMVEVSGGRLDCILKPWYVCALKRFV